jgi:hypothetical protein
MKTAVICFLLIIISIHTSYGQRKTKERTGKFGITISLPCLNSFRFHHYEKNKDSTAYGFVGTGLALFYKTNKNKISLGYGRSTNALAPFGVVDYFSGSKSKIVCEFFEALYHKKIRNRTKITGGINVNRYHYTFEDFDTGYFFIDMITRPV